MQRYYKQIHDMPPLSEQEMNAHLAEESRVRQRAAAARAEPGRRVARARDGVSLQAGSRSLGAAGRAAGLPSAAGRSKQERIFCLKLPCTNFI